MVLRFERVVNDKSVEVISCVTNRSTQFDEGWSNAILSPVTKRPGSEAQICSRLLFSHARFGAACHLMSPEVVLMSLSIMRPGEVAVSDKAMSLISWLFGFLRLMGELPRSP